LWRERGKNSQAVSKSHNDFSAEDGNSGKFQEDSGEIRNGSLRITIYRKKKFEIRKGRDFLSSLKTSG